MNSTNETVATSQLVQQTLNNDLNPIVARGVFRYALKRCSIDENALDRQGLSAKFVDELEYGMRTMTSDDAVRQRCKKALRKLLTRQRSTPLTSTARSSAEKTPENTIEIQDEFDIVRARNTARGLAQDLGFSITDQTKIATAVSEISRNIFNYAKTGTVSLNTVNGTRVGLRIEAKDHGPGIKNLDEILAGQYVSKTGMGLGIRGCQRLMDQFRITSNPRSGTSIVMEKYC